MPDRRAEDQGSHRHAGAIAGVIVSACVLLGPATPPAAAAPEWQALAAAPVSSRIDDLHFLDPLTGWVANGDGAIYHTTDGGASWALQFSDPSVYFRSLRFTDPQHGWAGTLVTAKLLFATVNGGATWTVVPNIPDPKPNGICGLWTPSSQVIYGVGSYSGPARMIKTVDGGATWTSKDLSAQATTLVDVYFWNDLEGLAVGGLGTYPASCRAVVLRTTDGGATWQQRHLGSRLGEWCWKISFPAADTGFVSLERHSAPVYVLKTVDRGLTWTELPSVSMTTQGIGFATPRIGWIGGANQPPHETTDGGATWTQTPWGERVNRFQFFGPDYGYASGVTVYKYTEKGPIGVEPSLPSRPTLAALPNPFGPSTTIRYVLAARARVTLLVADPAGRIVRRLAAGSDEDAGAHQVTWDGRDDAGGELPAGIYLYVLHAGDRHEMGKLVRVR